MQSIQNLRSLRAVFGAITLTALAACADAPAGPTSLKPASDAVLPKATSVFPDAAVGLNIVRRDVLAPDGVRYTIETAKGEGGLPSEVRVLRGGEPVALLTNEWQRTSAGFVLQRQQMVRYVAGGASKTFDTRAMGGAASMIGSPVAVNRPDSLGFRQTAVVRTLYGTYDLYGGPCDMQARAVESALEDWLLSVLGIGGATATGNPWAAASAYAYQLKKYRDVMRAEAALDQCVADAGKPPEFF